MCESQAFVGTSCGKINSSFSVTSSIFNSFQGHLSSFIFCFPELGNSGKKRLALHARLFSKGIEGCTVYSPGTEL